VDIGQLRQAAQPDEARAALAASAEELSHAAGPHHPIGDMVDVRTATYRGHEVVVRTHYEITVDGEPFDVHLAVANNGRVFYHGIPTRDFGSAIDLVKKAIDIFGDEFADNAPSHDHHQHHHGGEH
jgi:hypothetical protein